VVDLWGNDANQLVLVGEPTRGVAGDEKLAAQLDTRVRETVGASALSLPTTGSGRGRLGTLDSAAAERDWAGMRGPAGAPGAGEDRN
jgi:hypothetical protein